MKIRYSTTGRTETKCPFCDEWTDMRPYCSGCGEKLDLKRIVNEDGTFKKGFGYTEERGTK